MPLRSVVVSLTVLAATVATIAGHRPATAPVTLALGATP
jgi:hypothetical protein